jgi:hypothetical protein
MQEYPTIQPSRSKWQCSIDASIFEGKGMYWKEHDRSRGAAALFIII